MTRFKKIAVAALAVTLTGAVALPAVADRGGHGWGKGSGHGSGMMGGRHGRGQMAMRFMERFDTDADGKITQAEIDATVTEMYAAADADTSGGVTLDEFKAAYVREFSDLKVRAFQRLDTDGDGSVSKAEFEARGGRMMGGGGRGMHSGMMGQGMMGQMGQGMMGQGQGMMGQMGQGRGQGMMGQGMGMNNDDGRGPRHARRRQARVLTATGDLSVTKAEVERPTSRIVSMMDSNGDGVLSMEDHRRHHGGWGQGKRGGN
eukprot:jgi/Tetstr1/440738/TSEL_029046.t1